MNIPDQIRQAHIASYKNLVDAESTLTLAKEAESNARKTYQRASHILGKLIQLVVVWYHKVL